MDIDSPTSHRSEDNEEDNDDDNDDNEVSGYDAQLLELEPLREDSDDEELIDDDDDASKQEDNNESDGQDDEQDGSSSASSEEEEDTHVQGLTSNEREILTLLAVDKKLASLLDLAANALSALRPKEVSPAEANTTSTETPTQPEEPSKAFEKASAEYYKALDDIQLTLRNSIHLIRKARISPRTLMENPSLGSVLSNTSGGSGSSLSDSSKDDSNERVDIAPGVVGEREGSNGLSRGAMRMEIETWKQGIVAMRSLLDSLNTKATSTNGQ